MHRNAPVTQQPNINTMKRNTNAVVRAFEAAFVSELEAVGIKPSGTVSYSEETPVFTVETRAGRYTFYYDPQIGEKPLNFIGVTGRFKEPERAKRITDCNPFNGKWNFQGIGRVTTIEEAKEHATSIVTRILSV